MIEEDFLVQGDTKNMFVMLLHEEAKDPTVYFYYPYEMQLGIKPKPNDIEPVRINKTFKAANKEYILVISRFHYFGLIVWVYALQRNSIGTIMSTSKPVLSFMRNFHTPIMNIDPDITKYRKRNIVDGYKNHDFEKLNYGLAVEFIEVLYGKQTILHKIRNKLFGKKSKGQPKEYPGIVREVKPRVISDEKQLFNNTTIRNNSSDVFFIGDDYSIKDVISTLENGSGEVTKDSIQMLL